MATATAPRLWHGLAFRVEQQALAWPRCRKVLNCGGPGLEAPVLLLSNLNEPDDLRTCLHWRLMPTLSSLRDAQLCNALAADSGRRFDVQLKIDTGMARLGCSLSDGHQTAAELQSLDHLNLAGIYSHLACADEPDDALTSLQQERFLSMLSALPQGGTGITRHLANSAGTLLNRELHHDLVRVGLACTAMPLRVI